MPSRDCILQSRIKTETFSLSQFYFARGRCEVLHVCVCLSVYMFVCPLAYLNKMQPETADFALGAAIWRNGVTKHTRRL